MHIELSITQSANQSATAREHFEYRNLKLGTESSLVFREAGALVPSTYYLLKDLWSLNAKNYIK